MITQHAELTEFGRLWAEAMAKDFCVTGKEPKPLAATD